MIMNKRHVYLLGISAVIIASSLLMLAFKPASNGDGTYATMRIYENFSVVSSKIVITYANEERTYATMRIYENFSVVSSKIVITYANEESEIIELGPFKYNDQYMTDNNLVINKAMNSMANKGYRLVSSSSSGKINSNKSMKISTHIFEKR
jgi:hypothetical protein